MFEKYRDDLDAMVCADCGKGHEGEELQLASTCHRDDPIYATYIIGTGLVQLRCTVCKLVVAEIVVAKREVKLNTFL